MSNILQRIICKVNEGGKLDIKLFYLTIKLVPLKIIDDKILRCNNANIYLNIKIINYRPLWYVYIQLLIVSYGSYIISMW